MLQENLQRWDDDLIELEFLHGFESNTQLPVKSELVCPSSVVSEPVLIGGQTSMRLEKRVFADMRSAGFSLLLHLLDAESGIELLKNLVSDIELELLKYHAGNTRPDLASLNIPGAIDAMETAVFVGDLKQIRQKKQRLTRRLVDWAPPSYLIVNAVLHTLQSDNAVVDAVLVARLRKTIGQYHLHRNRMAQANMRLVYSVANRFRHLGLPFEDLAQEGHLGLIKAIERFDIAKGFRFSTYAHIVISQSIHLALDKQMAMVRLPYKALREKASVEKTRQSLEQALGRSPYSYELARHLPDELEYKDIHIANNVEPNASSQLLYVLPEDMESLAALQPAEQEILTGSLSHRDLAETMLERLNARESYIVRLRYGIGVGKEFTLEEISMAMGLSRERVRQLAHQAVEKLGRIYAASR
jgi:RNA polymerase sigma factor (sigma-70 family)